jgi:aminoglycoside phosphotransferase family enzyme
VLIAALLQPGRYPHPVATVEHLQTHISHVLLAGDYAYKIKKPLNLGFWILPAWSDGNTIARKNCA